MLLTNMLRANGRSPISWRFVWIGLAVLLAAWPAAALSQPPFSTSDFLSQAEDDSLPLAEFSGQSGQALGALIRGGVVTGPGVGREDTLAPLEFMPYFFLEDGVLFGDLRGFASTEDRFGANTGLGYRHYFRKWDRIIGGNFFYDYDNTSGQLFRQVGAGLETLGANWDMRLNTYFPVTQNTKEIELSDPFNLRFNANNILFDQIRTFGVHLKGLDHEIAFPLPGRILERHNVRAAGGWYHFQQTGVTNTWGWRGRLEGDLLANVHLGLDVTNDNTFDTNVVFSVAVSYGGFQQPLGQPKTQFNRMTTPVLRSYNAIVQRNPVLEAGLVATNPDGTPIFVEHVASNNPYDRSNILALRRLAPQYDPTAPLGTFENPYLTIPEAQAPTTPVSDIVFVWTNSEFTAAPDPLVPTTAIRTEGGVRLLGEADNAPHTVLIGDRTVLLPRAVDNPDPDPTDLLDLNTPDLKPLFVFDPAGPVLNGVELFSGIPDANGVIQVTEFSGFRLGLGEVDPDVDVRTTGPTGNGIFAGTINPITGNPQTVSNVLVQYDEIYFAQGDGVQLNSVGNINFNGNRIFGSRQDGFHVIGGTPQITFSRDLPTFNLNPAQSEIENAPLADPVAGTNPLFVQATGYGIHLEGLETGSSVAFAGRLGNQTVTASRVNYFNALGVLVENSAGLGQFGIVDVTDSPDENDIDPITGNPIYPVGMSTAAIELTNNTGNFVFQQPVTITRTSDLGIFVNGNQGNVTFNEDVLIQDHARRGIVLDGNDGDVTFIQNVDVNISANATGNFLVNLTSPDPRLPPPALLLQGEQPNSQTAVSYQNSAGDVTFRRDLGIDNSVDNALRQGAGIRIGEVDPGDDGDRPNIGNTGNFTVSGTTSIDFVRDAGILVTNDLATVVFSDVNITNRGLDDDFLLNPLLLRPTAESGGIRITNQQAPVTFNGITTVDNDLDSQDTAVVLEGSLIDALNFEQNGSVSFQSLNIDNAIATFDDLPSGLRIGNEQTALLRNGTLPLTNGFQSSVTIQELQIQADNGTALSILSVGDPNQFTLDTTAAIGVENRVDGGVVINRGTIDATDGAAIIAEDSIVRLTLNSVNSSNSPVQGIRFIDNVARTASLGFALQVLEDGDITDALLQGAFFQNTQNISLNGMVFDNNGLQGIAAVNLEEVRSLTFTNYADPARPDVTVNVNVGRVGDNVATGILQLTNLTVQDSGSEGLFALDIEEVSVIGTDPDGSSLFQNNGTNPTQTINDEDPEILIQVSRPLIDPDLNPAVATNLPYRFQITNVEILEANILTDAVRIETIGGGGDPILNLLMNGTNVPPETRASVTIAGNTANVAIAGDGFDPAGLRVVWNGDVLPSGSNNFGILVDGYQFLVEDFNGIGIALQGDKSDGNFTATIQNNLIDTEITATNAIGIFADMENVADITINDNVIALNADNSTGIQMDLRNLATITIDGTVDNFDVPTVYTTFSPIPDENVDNPAQPFGNIILLNADNTTGIDLRFRTELSQLTISNTLIDDTLPITLTNTPNVILVGGVQFPTQGITIRTADGLGLNSPLNNSVLLDRPDVNQLFSHQAGTDNSFFFIDNTNVTGSILINNTPLP